MKRVLLLFAILVSCTNIYEDQLPPVCAEAKDYIEINTTRNAANLMNEDSGITKSDNDVFSEIREVECFESVILPELQPHIWLGNVLLRQSVIDCQYKPLIYERHPITVALTLPGTDPVTIEEPSYSKYMNYIKEQSAKGTYFQNTEFNYTIEQFTSYNELKSTFGSNVNTDALFWHSSTETSESEHKIEKATGLYVRFYQTSFKAVMDYPEGKVAEIPDILVDDAVYVNSITYGRLGILTLETNETAEYANTIINSVFKKVFSRGNTSYTEEEEAFLNSCSFKVYLIGGNGNSSVESFNGLEGFIQHIKKGEFSKEQPGVPIFCSFNHVKDNSPLSINFRYSIKKEQLYVEMSVEVTESTDTEKYGNVTLHFYKDRSKIPTIADPNIVFLVNEIEKYAQLNSNDDDESLTINEKLYANKNKGISLTIVSNKRLYKRWTERNGSHYEGFSTEIYAIEYSYELQNSIENKYIILGTNPISYRDDWIHL